MYLTICVPLTLITSAISSTYFGKDDYYIAFVAFRVPKILFSVLGLSGIIILGKDPSKISVLTFIHVDVAVKEVTDRYFCETFMNNNPVLDEILEIFSSLVQSPPDPLMYSILEVLLYLQIFLK